MTDIEPIGVECARKGLDLRLGHPLLRFAQLREVFRADVGCQQADDRHHHQQFEQREATGAAPTDAVASARASSSRVARVRDRFFTVLPNSPQVTVY